MILKILTVGALQTNCYILGAEAGGSGVVIDPGAQAADILDEIDRLDLSISHVIATHGHFDHVDGLDEVARATGAKVCINRVDVDMLDQPGWATPSLGSDPSFETALDLAEGDRIETATGDLSVWHTPGHTRGSVCLLLGKSIFTGDLLFRGSVGRTDLPGGSWAEMEESLRRLIVLPDQTIVYPGHGPQTTIGEERIGNPYLTRLTEEGGTT